MTELERIQKYIDRTRMTAKAERFYLGWGETCEMTESIRTINDAITIVALAFNYGKAKGYRAAKAEVRT